MAIDYVDRVGRMKSRRPIVGGAAVFVAALAGAGAAVAQDEGPAEESGRLETIVVTAQFVKQAAQDTPIAITAISGEALEMRGVVDTAMLGKLAPNVQLSQGGSFYGNSLIAFIRGVGQGDSAPSVEPGVGLYIDDVFYSTTAGAFLDLLDLERVEILRGPQGTLAGKNSIGGAIKLFSRRPDGERYGYLEVATGSLDALKIRAGSNFTLKDGTLYARISGVSNSRNGHVKLFDFGCLYPNSPFASGFVGNDGESCRTGTTGGVDTKAAKIALRWIASDAVEVNLSTDFLNDNSEAAANTLLATGPTVPVPIFDSRIPGLAWDAVNLFFDPSNPLSGPPVFPATIPTCVYVTSGPGACPAQLAALGGSFLNDPYASFAEFAAPDAGLFVPQENKLRSRGMTANIDWQLAPDLQLQSITGYRNYDMGWSLDQDQSPVAVATLYQTFEHEQTTQELRLNGKLGARLDWTLGAFYLDSETVWTGRVNIGYGGVDFVHGPDPINGSSWAAFANGIFGISDRFQLAAGVRYSDDKKDYTFNRRNPNLAIPGNCIGPPGTPGNPPNCALAPLNAIVSTFEGDRIDYRAALSYFINDDAHLYGSVSSGYKSGGVNSRPFFPAQALPHDPEELITYEIGAKTELFGKTVRLNGAVFFNDYQNIVFGLGECSAIVGPAFATPCFLPANAGEAAMWGAELEFAWLPVDNLRLEGSVSWLDFEFTRVNPATGITLGTTPPFTPKFKASFGALYDYKLPNGTLSARLDIVHQDDMYTEAVNTQFNFIEQYTLLDAGIHWTSPDEGWQVKLEGRNLTDKYYLSAATDLFAPGGGSASAAPGLPRTFTVSVRRNF